MTGETSQLGTVAGVVCPSCGGSHSPAYVACPHCSRAHADSGSTGVTTWSSARVRWLAIGTASPILLLLLQKMLPVVAQGPVNDSVIIMLMFINIGLIGISWIAMILVYLNIAAHSPIPSSQQAIWGIGIFFWSFVAFPVAFFFLVWRPRHR